MAKRIQRGFAPRLFVVGRFLIAPSANRPGIWTAMFPDGDRLASDRSLRKLIRLCERYARIA